jgi:hypothetical protein|tara:strand:- start:12702 stop:13562 length:861 start_codon:yes stop_codon:yes gene_type:complete
MNLSDGVQNIPTISVIGCFKNSQNYLETFFIPMMNTFETYYSCTFTYFFIENNSSDNTSDILERFISTKTFKSKLFRFNVENDYVNKGKGITYDRIGSILKVRNMLMDKITPIDSKWSIIIDSGIYFKKDILLELFKINPKINDIGMVTPYTQQMFLKNVHLPATEENKLLNHYFDTYAFTDIHGQSHYPSCAFEKCKVCNNSKKTTNNLVKIDQETSIVDVSSCFGGFSLIDNEIFNEHNIRWDSVTYNEQTESICEHVLFCYLIRKLAKKRIVILQNVDSVFRI